MKKTIQKNIGKLVCFGFGGKRYVTHGYIHSYDNDIVKITIESLSGFSCLEIHDSYMVNVKKIDESDRVFNSIKNRNTNILERELKISKELIGETINDPIERVNMFRDNYDEYKKSYDFWKTCSTEDVMTYFKSKKTFANQQLKL